MASKSDNALKATSAATAKMRRQALALYNGGRRGEALPLYQQLLQQCPDDPDIHLHLGLIHYGQLQFGEAIARFEYLFESMPDNGHVRRYLFAAVRDANHIDRMLELAELFLKKPLDETEVVLAFLAFATVCDWSRMEQLKQRCIAALLDGTADPTLLPGFCLDALGMNDIDLDVRFQLSKKTGETKQASFHQQDHAFHPNANPIRKRLKIGYLSGDFRNHAVGYFSYAIMVGHDKSKFEIYCYSGTHHRDEITNMFGSVVEHFVDVATMSAKQIAERVRSDGIDVLIDLGGHTSSSLLGAMFYRPAPVQITYLGFASTTGLDIVDFRITDHMAEGVNADQYYTEELLYLPDCFVCFGMQPSCPRSSEPPVQRNGYITFGSFNNKRKMNPDVVALWSKILKRVPNSKLALKTIWGDSVISNVVHEFMKHDIAVERLIFFKFTDGYDEHVNTYNAIDIALDPFPYTGTTTTCEALWMGIPVITLVGESHANRVSYSILKSVGYEEGISFSEEEYVDNAVKLAMNPDGLAVLRPALHTLFQYSSVARPDIFTPNLEALYIRACEQKGLNTSSLGREDSLAGKEKDDPFSHLPGFKDSRGLMVVTKLTNAVKSMANAYLQTNGAPEWMLVIIPDNEKQDDIASYFEQLESDARHQFCVLKFDNNVKRSTYRSLVTMCGEYHRVIGRDRMTKEEKTVHRFAKSRGLKIVEHDKSTLPSLMLFDRLTPDLWRMLRTYYAEAGTNKNPRLVLAVPHLEDRVSDRDKIAGYLQNMHQFETSPDRQVKLEVGGSDEDETTFLTKVLRQASSLHVPKGSSSPMQKQAIEMAEDMGLTVKWHNEKPTYEPEPLPPLEDFHVTVVILTYNRVELLKRAVESVLKQTCKDVTLIISDDCSSDGTEEYCNALAACNDNVVYQRNAKNIGQSKNYTRAMESISSELLLLLADDDFLLDHDAMKQMVDHFRENPYLGMVFGQCSIGDISGKHVSSHIPGNMTTDCILDTQQMLLDSIDGNHIFGGGNIVRQAALKHMSKYASEHWRPISKWDVLAVEGDYLAGLLMLTTVPVTYVDVPAVYYSVGSDTFSSAQLGGGWSIEIRLRTVALLDDMYIKTFGLDAVEDKRIKSMLLTFKKQYQQIIESLPSSERAKHKQKLNQFKAIMNGLSKHALSEVLLDRGLLDH